MEKTDVRRRRRPQSRPHRPPSQSERRQPAGRSRPPAPPGRPPRREEAPSRSRQQARPRPGQPPRAGQASRPVRRPGTPAPKRPGTHSAPPRRPAPPRSAPPRRRESAEYRARQEQERRRRQMQSQRRIMSVLLVLIASMLAVFCLYRPDDTAKPVLRSEVEAHTDPPPPTESPTEPPTAPPTEPPTELPTVALPTGPIVVTPIRTLDDLAALQVPEYVSVQIINVDGTSRRGEKLTGIKNIVIHYVGNPGATGQQNHDWYTEPNSEVSSHFVVGLQGEVIQCIPLDEKSSASNHRNGDTISIEVCHTDESGKFTDASYNSVVDLAAWLVKACGLKVEDVIRHYEVTGKECPRYYVEHEDAWWQLRADIAARAAQ